MPKNHPTATAPRMRVGQQAIVQRTDFPALLATLRRRGYRVVGPTVREGAIVYDDIASETDLPIGWTDEQGPGSYRLKRRADEALFGYNVGPQGWKRLLHPPRVRLWQADRDGDGDSFRVTPEPQEPPRYAFLGVRACELQAIAVQDKVFLGSAYTDPTYRARREGACIIAANCGQAGATCFCASMGTGPRARSMFDLALTELLRDDAHIFVVEVGSTLGAELMRDVPHTSAPPETLALAEQVMAETAAHMQRTLDTNGIHDLLVRNADHPRWEEVAARCLTCGNCTAVCPTCFCTSVEDTTDITGTHAERTRRWDSCFTADFSYIAGGVVRRSGKSRYRQWMTHKLATWTDQFGMMGCVGCGRCITWCPVGIDITEEAAALRADVGGGAAKTQET